MEKQKQKKKMNKSQLTLIILCIILVIAWYLCWIVVPAIPNERCVGICGGGGSGGGGVGGSGGLTSGSSGVSYTCAACPACDTCADCPDCPECDDRCVYSDKFGCMPTASCCPEGYDWYIMEGICGYDVLQNVVCPDNSIYNTEAGYCVCVEGYSQDIFTGCCSAY